VSARRRSDLYLFSIDLEDIRTLVPDGHRYADRVEVNTHRYLDFLAERGMRCSVFAVGDVARRYPSLMKRVVEEGHELGTHTDEHIPVDRHTPESFREDVMRCLDAFDAAGAAEKVVGFRAPIASLVARSRWAYALLAEMGFKYSASVLAAPHPLYGWPEYGPDLPRRVDGVWEIPSSLSQLPGLNVPFVGGVYQRVLPFALVRWLARRRLERGFPAIGYIHPYDIDTEQERFMHPEINENRFYNWLLYYNRHDVFRRMEGLLALGTRIVPFREYLETVLEQEPEHLPPLEPSKDAAHAATRRKTGIANA